MKGNSKVSLLFFTVKELLDLNVPGVPTTKAGIYDRIRKQGWQERIRGGRGGKAGGTKEYSPPPDVLALIEAKQRGEFVQSKGRANPVRTVPVTGQVGAPPSAPTGPAGPYSYAASMTAPWVPDAIAEVAVRAMLVLSNLPDIPATLSAKQRSGLVLRLFELLMMATRGDYKKVQELMDNQDALLAALRLAWEAESQDGAAG